VGLQNLYDGRPQTAAMTVFQPVTPRYQLLMGPWMHVTTGTGINIATLELEWFDTWLLGQNTPMAHATEPLHLQKLNSTQWVNAARWPLPAAPATAFYFGAGRSGSDAVSTNDGTLTRTRPTAASGSDTVVFGGVSSPCDVQTDQWGAGFLALALGDAGTTNPCDENDVTLGAGPGALTYTTAPFAKSEILAGPIDATVYTASTSADTELAATVEAVSPAGQSLPLTSGALLGSLRSDNRAQSWTGGNGLPLLPVHPLTAGSRQLLSPGTLTRQDIEVFPTFALIPAGWRLRVTLTTAETPHLLATVAQLPALVGGLYQIQRHDGAASFLNVPLAPASAYDAPCGSMCSAAGP